MRGRWVKEHLCTQKHAKPVAHSKDVFITMSVLIILSWREVNDQK
nr:MAG TPA: hypothetical protein [Caudoviricetes sp.]